MERLRSWSRALPASSLLVLAAMLAACDGPRVSYVKSGDVAGSEARLFIRVPEGWRLFEEEDFLDQQSEDLTEEQIQALRDRQWLVIFDADPRPSIDHLAPDADHPAGFAQIRQLAESEADYSIESLKSEVFPYSELRFQDGFELLGQKELEGLPDDLEGVELSYVFDLDGTPVRVTQVGALDPANRVIYLTVIACKESCFEDEQRVIRRLISSWTVEGSL
jgi:hypothetical protein